MENMVIKMDTFLKILKKFKTVYTIKTIPMLLKYQKVLTSGEMHSNEQFTQVDSM